MNCDNKVSLSANTVSVKERIRKKKRGYKKIRSKEEINESSIRDHG